VVCWVLTVPTPRTDWEKTSLKPYVDILDKHAIRIMNEVRQGKIKTGESMLFIPKGFELTCVRRQHLVVVGFEYICVFMLLCCTRARQKYGNTWFFDITRQQKMAKT